MFKLFIWKPFGGIILILNCQNVKVLFVFNVCLQVERAALFVLNSSI